jgi:hypothetical protein
MAGYYLTVHTSSTFLSTSLTKEVLETIAFATTGWCLKKLGGSLATAVHTGSIPRKLARNEYCTKCIVYMRIASTSWFFWGGLKVKLQFPEKQDRRYSDPKAPNS